jgi:hypothetical protein
VLVVVVVVVVVLVVVVPLMPVLIVFLDLDFFTSLFPLLLLECLSEDVLV